MSKFLSGRFIFTVISALVFAQMAVSGRINGEQSMSIIMLIISFYFNRQDRTKPEGGAK